MSWKQLHFTQGHDPRNTILSLNRRQPIYKIVTPFKLLGRTSTVFRLETTDDSSPPDFTTQNAVQLAEIEWRTIGESRLKLIGYDVPMNEYFRQSGPDWRRRARDHVFVATNGREYVWKMNGPLLELFPNDDSKTLIADFQPSTLGRFGPNHLSVLRILPAGEDIMDIIVITFVYIEGARR